MIYIPMNILEYRFDEEGNTKQIVVGFQTYTSHDNLNARINLTIEDIKSVNEAWDFDNLTQDRCEAVARRKLQAWVRIQKPVEDGGDN